MSSDVTADPTGPVRALMDGWVASGRVPGYVVALRHAGTTHVLHGGADDEAGGCRPPRRRCSGCRR